MADNTGFKSLKLLRTAESSFGNGSEAYNILAPAFLNSIPGQEGGGHRLSICCRDLGMPIKRGQWMGAGLRFVFPRMFPHHHNLQHFLILCRISVFFSSTINQHHVCGTAMEGEKKRPHSFKMLEKIRHFFAAVLSLLQHQDGRNFPQYFRGKKSFVWEH